MQNQILANLDHPRALEKLYRADKSAFRRAFDALYPELDATPVADFWQQRLHFDRNEAFTVDRGEIVFVIIAVLVAGTCAKLPEILSIDEAYFYTRNLGFLVFPFVSAHFIRKNKLPGKSIALVAGLMGFALLAINLFPGTVGNSDTLLLSCIHLVLFLWATTGFAFVGKNIRSSGARLGYLSHNGDLIVVSTLLLISGGILTAITIGLFGLIGYRIGEYYFRYVVLFGLPAVPIVATVLTQTIPELVQKVSPIIARIFSPLVFIMLLIYLGAIVFSGKDPYNDRDFLLIFNVLLVGVMALIFFSVAERAKSVGNRYELMVLFLLSAVTILVNGIALSAIVFRISEWGITPNRITVLGANILILINLLLVSRKLLKVLTRDADLAEVGKAIAIFLPVYWGWTALVTFGFPLIFGFR